MSAYVGGKGAKPGRGLAECYQTRMTREVRMIDYVSVLPASLASEKFCYVCSPAQGRRVITWIPR